MSDHQTIYCSCWRTEPEIYYEDWYGVTRAWVAGPPAFNSSSSPYIAAARAIAGLVQCHACGRIAPWRGEPVGQCNLDTALEVIRRFYDEYGHRRPQYQTLAVPAPCCLRCNTPGDFHPVLHLCDPCVQAVVALSGLGRLPG